METVLQLLQSDFKIVGTNGVSLVLVCAAILFWIVERDKLGDRIGRFMKYVILFFVLTANPFGYNDISTFWMEGQYWKVFLVLLPVICIAIPVVEILSREKALWKKVLGAAVFVGIMAVSMNFKFSDISIAIPENSNKVTDEILEVDQIIRESGIVTNNMIAPRAVCAEIREIDEGIHLLYGEDLIVKMTEGTAKAADEEEQQFLMACSTIVAVPSAVDYQINVANVYGSNCILLETSYDDAELMEEAGFVCYGRTENYAVYFRS